MPFHAQNGLYIERLKNGDVHIYQDKDGNRIMDETMKPNEFASFICCGSLDDEHYGQWYAAMQFLGVPGFEDGWNNYQNEKQLHENPKKETTIILNGEAKVLTEK
jgi:hypothetical protein